MSPKMKLATTIDAAATLKPKSRKLGRLKVMKPTPAATGRRITEALIPNTAYCRAIEQPPPPHMTGDSKPRKDAGTKAMVLAIPMAPAQYRTMFPRRV